MGAGWTATGMTGAGRGTCSNGTGATTAAFGAGGGGFAEGGGGGGGGDKSRTTSLGCFLSAEAVIPL
jgi:hypothetical protein